MISILEDVAARIADPQFTADVVAFSRRLPEEPSLVKHCSYAAHMREYVLLKRDRKRGYHWTYGAFCDNGKLATIRRRLYLDPCKTCSTCQKRRKPWPN